MILTIVRNAVTYYSRDRVALVITFVVPVLVFTIFAVIFGGMGGDKTQPIELAVADEDGSEASRRFVESLQNDSSLSVLLAPEKDSAERFDRNAVHDLVATGRFSAALVIPKGFSESFGMFGGPDRNQHACELLIDKSNPIAGPMVAGLLQRAAMTAAPDLMMQRGVEMLDNFVIPLTDEQRDAIRQFAPRMRDMLARREADKAEERRVAAGPKQGASQPPQEDIGGPVAVKIVDVVGEGNEKQHKDIISFQAAATAVMFLLFCASAAAGALLEEEESGVLERLLSSRMTMTQLLLGKWVMIGGLGALQVTVMFVWGALIFHVDLLHHLGGFAIMTITTAAAAAALGLVLATLCRTRAQAGGLSTITILIMSAVGGSMIPRYLMPEAMKKAGYLTFNAWALDGYQKVFWYDRPLIELWPQVLVLSIVTVALLAIARVLARRWETS